jgi:hypothetical protein
MTQVKDGTEFQEGVDYLYCSHCRIHVPCRRLPSGGWEVQCPGCAGECGFCQCYLRRFCFGSREQFPPLDPDHLLVPGPGPTSE